MEEIDLKEIIYFMFKKIFWVILLTILGGIAGIVYTKYLVKPMYSSYTTVVLSKPTTASSDYTSVGEAITQNDITLNSKLIATYSEIMKSRAVATEVKEKLGLDIKEETLMSNISVSEKDDTEMLKIQVSNTDPVIAADVANTLSEVFREKVKQIYNIENVTVIDVAIPSTVPDNVNYIKNGVLFALVGCMAACGIIFLLFYFDTRIKSKSQVEELLGLEVLAVIPELKN